MEQFFTMVEYKLKRILLLLEKLKTTANSNIKSSLELVIIDNQFVDVHSIMFHDVSLILTEVKKFNTSPSTDKWDNERFYFLNFKPMYSKFIEVTSKLIIPTIATAKDTDSLIGMIRLLNDLIVRGNKKFGLCLDNYSPEIKQQIMLDIVCQENKLDEFIINDLNSEKEFS